MNLIVGLRDAIYRHIKAERVALNAPLTFDASIKQIGTLALGKTLVLIPEDRRLQGESLIRYLHTHRVDVLDCTPFHFSALQESGWARDARRVHVLLGGEVVEPRLLQLMPRHVETAWFNLYGPTECTVDAAVSRLRPEDAEATVGQPLPNVRIYVLDAHLNPVPQGVTGELFIGGRGVARGYLDAPGLTADRFVPDPFSKPGARMYGTGDLARVTANGVLVVHGRLDRQLKIRGCRVDPAEIERALRGLGMFGDVAVVPFEDSRSGTSLAACVVPRSDTFESERIRQVMRDALPDYMVPARFVRLTALPVTSGGKLDLRALAVLTKAGATADGSYLAPRSSFEAAVAEEWRALLGVERVGARDNFFDLGGHSLLLAQLQVRLKRRFQRDIPMVELFRHPTVEHLAAYLAGGAEVAAQPRLEQAIERAALRRRALERTRD